jgi:hypothetical protein
MLIRRLGDAAVALLKAGADTQKKDVDGLLALDLAPDKDASLPFSPSLINERLLLTGLGHRFDYT